MTVSASSNIPNLLVMIRPLSFGFNSETAASNSFQKKTDQQNTSEVATVEFDNMIKKMRDHEINVKVFEDKKLGLPDSVFSNNWMVHLPEKKLTVFPMFTKNRRAEVREDILNWIETTTKTDYKIDLTDKALQNKFLEGTGSIVFDYRNKIAYASESPRTDVSLFEDFCTEIGYIPVSFQSFDLTGNPVYHTNVVLTIADNYCIGCLDSSENPVERKMLEMKLSNSGHELIQISHKQMNLFAGNCIEVLNQKNESCLLMSKTAFEAFTETQKNVIRKYSQIIWFDIPVIESVGGGSVRCMITGLFAGLNS